VLSKEIVETGRESLFHTSWLSERGGREWNEDCYDFLQLGPSVCWAIADGLGGHQGGQVASQIAVKAVIESFRGNPGFSQVGLQQHMTAAHEAVQKAQQDNPALAGMRTTLVVMLTDSKRGLWAHVGDSRLYRFQKRGIAEQTEDHSVPQALVKAGDITAAQVRGHCDRNRLLRSVGEPGEVQAAIPDAPRELCPGDAFLLCTDGFWEYVYETEMLADLVCSNSPGEWLARAQSRILRRASGEYDNYSAVAIFFSGDSVLLNQVDRNKVWAQR